MRRLHFNDLQPVCPRCLAAGLDTDPLQLHRVDAERDDVVLSGSLLCPNPQCLLEFPIIDGIPVLTPNPAQTLSDQIDVITRREDLPQATRSMLGDAAGQGSQWDTSRQHLSIYGWDAYGEFARANNVRAASPPGAVARTVHHALSRAPARRGNTLDLGCSVGRSTFELAAAGQGLVLGVDLSFSMLAFAQRALLRDNVTFDVRRVGVVYDEVTCDTAFASAPLCDFWLCDATVLPFKAASLDHLAAFNVLDCLPSPLGTLQEIDRLLSPGGDAILTTPYDWSIAATPVEQWLGGHSQRGGVQGDSAAMLRSLLTPGAHPQSLPGLQLVAEEAYLPWQTRLHDRSTVSYDAHLTIAAKAGP